MGKICPFNHKNMEFIIGILLQIFMTWLVLDIDDARHHLCYPYDIFIHFLSRFFFGLVRTTG